MNRVYQLHRIKNYFIEKGWDTTEGILYLHPWFMKELNIIVQTTGQLWNHEVLRLEVQNPPTGYSWYYEDKKGTVFSFDGDDQKIARTKINEA